MRLTRRQLVKCVLATALVPLAGCRGKASGPGEVSRTLFYFDTVCTIGGLMDVSVLDEAEALCERCENLFSRTIPTSDVSRINDAGGEACEVDPMTADLIGRALAYCRDSQGLFDITIGAVSRLWDFREGVVPGAEEVSEALEHVGWERVEVTESAVRLTDSGAALDLGGIAKGYITDRLIDLFVERGVSSAYVNLGGNVAVLGPKATGEPWSIGVRDPFDEGGESVVAKVTSTSGSVVTSGLYERSFERQGRRYWHILDPRTGYPVETDLVSASIFSARSVDGDGNTKALFMLGVDAALDYLERRGLDGLLVGQDARLHTTRDSAFEAL